MSTPSRLSGSYALITPCMLGTVIELGRSARFDDLARLDATRADVDALGRALDQRTHTLDVRVPAALRPAVGVRHRHTPRGALATHFTNRCHDVLLRGTSAGWAVALGARAQPRRPGEAISGFRQPPQDGLGKSTLSSASRATAAERTRRYDVAVPTL